MDRTAISRRALHILCLALTCGCGGAPEGLLEVDAAAAEQPLASSPGAAKLYNADGILSNTAAQRIVLKGVNWFGFDDGNTAVDGLWAGPDSLSMDLGTVVRRMKALGFTAVRLPFSFADWKKAPTSQARGCKTISEDGLRHSTLPPGKTTSKALPKLPAPAPTPQGSCSSYLPTDSTFNRLVWTTEFFARNGFYVILDNQFNQDKTVLTDPTGWLEGWKKLLKAVSRDEAVSYRILVDILNEPDCANLRWEAHAGKPGVKDLYLRAMDALHPINLWAMFLIEGVGQGKYAMNWGDGLVTDAATIKRTGISDPNPFFNELRRKPYLNRIILGPHIYPPSISKAQSDYSGKALYNRLSTSFGTLSKTGHCVNGKCYRFPIIIGEIGSAMHTQTDKVVLADMAKWMLASGAGNDGRHQRVSGWFWWAWNANSGDTGGLVQANWRDLHWEKLTYLQGLGLRPWYL